jgi:hypothetical protein
MTRLVINGHRKLFTWTRIDVPVNDRVPAERPSNDDWTFLRRLPSGARGGTAADFFTASAHETQNQACARTPTADRTESFGIAREAAVLPVAFHHDSLTSTKEG